MIKKQDVLVNDLGQLVTLDYIVDLMSLYQSRRCWPDDYEALHKAKAKKTDLN